MQAVIRKLSRRVTIETALPVLVPTLSSTSLQRVATRPARFGKFVARRYAMSASAAAAEVPVCHSLFD